MCHTVALICSCSLPPVSSSPSCLLGIWRGMPTIFVYRDNPRANLLFKMAGPFRDTTLARCLAWTGRRTWAARFTESPPAAPTADSKCTRSRRPGRRERNGDTTTRTSYKRGKMSELSGRRRSHGRVCLFILFFTLLGFNLSPSRLSRCSHACCI